MARCPILRSRSGVISPAPSRCIRRPNSITGRASSGEQLVAMAGRDGTRAGAARRERPRGGSEPSPRGRFAFAAQLLSSGSMSRSGGNAGHACTHRRTGTPLGNRGSRAGGAGVYLPDAIPYLHAPFVSKGLACAAGNCSVLGSSFFDRCAGMVATLRGAAARERVDVRENKRSGNGDRSPLLPAQCETSSSDWLAPALGRPPRLR